MVIPAYWLLFHPVPASLESMMDCWRKMKMQFAAVSCSWKLITHAWNRHWRRRSEMQRSVCMFVHAYVTHSMTHLIPISLSTHTHTHTKQLHRQTKSHTHTQMHTCTQTNKTKTHTHKCTQICVCVWFFVCLCNCFCVCVCVCMCVCA